MPFMTRGHTVKVEMLAVGWRLRGTEVHVILRDIPNELPRGHRKRPNLDGRHNLSGGQHWWVSAHNASSEPDQRRYRRPVDCDFTGRGLFMTVAVLHDYGFILVDLR